MGPVQFVVFEKFQVLLKLLHQIAQEIRLLLIMYVTGRQERKF